MFKEIMTAEVYLGIFISIIFLGVAIRFALSMGEPLTRRFQGATSMGIISLAAAALAIAIKMML